MRKKILIALLSICALGTIAVSGALLKNDVDNALMVAAESISSDVVIADKYVLGETIQLPQHATLTYNGKTYNATVTLRDPDGRGYTGKEVVLNIAGQYTLEYLATTENGALIKETQVFDCLDTLYSLKGNSSKVHYGTFADYADAEEGLAVDLFAGDTLTFNKMLDVSQLSYDGGAFTEIIGLYVTPYTLYSEDVSQLCFTLTDAYNAENQITIVLKKYTTTVIANERTYAIHSYMTAGASSQQQIGLERTSKGDFAYGDGNIYKVHKNNFYGSALQFSMTGGFATDGSYVGKDKLSIGMNYGEAQIYSQTIRAGSIQRSLITDLDDKRLYDELWGGFTTGEAYLSITAMNYQAPACRFVITDVLGINEELMQSNSFKDEQAPTIEVRLDKDNQVPQAIVGCNYPVFKATAKDNYDGAVTVQTSVWANYKQSNAHRISLIDGVFVPEIEMEYSIVYTAKDRAANLAEKVIKVSAVSNLQRININLDEKVVSGKAGTSVQVAIPTLSGGTGSRFLQICAVNKDNDKISYEINNDSFTFLPLYAGTYEIIYTYGDYIETKTKTYEIVVENGTTPYIAEGVQLPKYVIKNGTYQFPEIEGYVFGDGTTKTKTCSILVRQDQGSMALTSNGKVKVNAENSITVIYQLNDGSHSFKREYTIPVVDTGFAEADKLDLSKYFYSDTMIASRENNNVLYTASGADGDTAKMEFIKSLLAENFSLDWRTDLAYSDYEGIRITLSDKDDKDISVVFTILNRNGKAVLTINNENVVYDLAQNFFEEKPTTFTLGYSDATQSILIPAGKVKIRNTFGGAAFNGFTSHFVNLEIELFGIKDSKSAKAGIRILKVNNQSFTALKNDIIEPEMTTRTLRGIMLLGDKVDILPLYAADVIDPYVQFTMKVTDPDKQTVKALDGTLLDGCDTNATYTIALEKYGRYTVYYMATDSAGWSIEYSYVLNVGENIAPTIKLTNKVENGKVGEQIAIAKVSVTDNMDANISVECYLKTPSEVFHNFSWEGIAYNAFVAKEAGIYTVYYYAIDSVGNYTIESYDIVIS